MTAKNGSCITIPTTNSQPGIVPQPHIPPLHIALIIGPNPIIPKPMKTIGKMTNAPMMKRLNRTKQCCGRRQSDIHLGLPANCCRGLACYSIFLASPLNPSNSSMYSEYQHELLVKAGRNTHHRFRSYTPLFPKLLPTNGNQ